MNQPQGTQYAQSSGQPWPQTLGFDKARLERVDERLREDIQAGRMHGAALMVSLHGEVILESVSGYADKAADRRLEPDSVFLTMSVAKAITNVLTLTLVERGLLRFHAPVAEVIPEFGKLGKQEVNLSHLLLHTAGLPQGLPPVEPDVLCSIEKLTAYVCDLPMVGIAGERVSYSMLVAQSVIAAMCLRVAGNGRSFATMLKEEVLEPLGMLDTSLGLRDDLADRLCTVRMAEPDPDALVTDEIAQLLCTPGIELPAAAMFTTITDLHRFTEMLRRGGEIDGARILSPAMLRYSAQNYTGTMRNMVWDSILPGRHWQPTPAALGLGFHVRGEQHVPGQSRFGALSSPSAFGGFGAGSAGCWVDPDHDLAISLLTTGLIEESRHVERTGLLSDMVISALV